MSRRREICRRLQVFKCRIDTTSIFKSNIDVRFGKIKINLDFHLRDNTSGGRGYAIFLRDSEPPTAHHFRAKKFKIKRPIVKSDINVVFEMPYRYGV